MGDDLKDACGDEGTVLLATLLVLSLMSAVTLALLATLRVSITKTAQHNDAAQAALYAQGAEDFARVQLTRVAQRDPELVAALTQGGLITLPFDQGMIQLDVYDGTHCVRLSGLSDANGIGNEGARRQFAALMGALDFDPFEAEHISAAALDWVDRDQQRAPSGAEDGTYMLRKPPHRTANVPFQSVSELRALSGMSETLFQRVRPYVCLGEVGAPTQFNIDSADLRHAPVLAAILGGATAQVRLAEDLIRARPSGGYGSLEALQASSLLTDVDLPDADFAAISFEADRVTVEALITFGGAQRARLLAFEGVDNGSLRLAYEDWGRETFRPDSRFRPEVLSDNVAVPTEGETP